MADPERGAPTVVLVDDHELFRKTLGDVLRGRGIDVVGEAESDGAARQLLEALRPDVVVMDAQLPDVDGVELTREIVESDASTRVVVLGPASSEENRVDVDRALGAGANA
jgi:DNA-binding NarL/FixJ family response regulator